MGKSKETKINPRVKDILKLIGIGVIASTAILVPGAAVVMGLSIKEYDKYKERHEENILGKYKMWRVRQIIDRLEKQKIIKIKDDIISISSKGKQKLLQYQLQEMRLKEKADGKWRIVIYDIGELNKKDREAFRGMLRRLKFLQLQKSVYLTPFPCTDEIEYIRQRFHIGGNVKMIVATALEDAEAYRAYFGL